MTDQLGFNIANLMRPTIEQRSALETEYYFRQSSSDILANNIYKQIIEFDKQLDDKTEVGAKLVTFGQTLLISIQEIGYIVPHLIIFKGVNENNDPIELIQHTSQISFVLVKTKRHDLKSVKREIGFKNYKIEEQKT